MRAANKNMTLKINNEYHQIESPIFICNEDGAPVFEIFEAGGTLSIRACFGVAKICGELTYDTLNIEPKTSGTIHIIRPKYA